jgi:MFS family permease
VPPRFLSLFTPAFVRVCAVSFAAFGAGFLLFPTAPFRLRDLGAPPEAAGWFLGGLTYGSALAAAWTGALGDLLGRRRVLTAAGALMALLAAVYWRIEDWRLLVACAVPHGVVWSSLLTATNIELFRVLPNDRRAEGFAYYAMMPNLAIAVAAPLGVLLIERSWPLLCATIATLNLAVAWTASRIDPDGPVAGDWPAKLSPRRAIDWRTLRVGVAMLLGSFGYGGITSFAALFAESRGIAPKGIFFTALGITILSTRPFVGPWLDRHGSRRALPFAFVAVALGLAAAGLPSTRWQVVAVAVVYGLGFAVLGPAFMAWTADNLGVARRGAGFGAILATFDLGIGTGSIALGPIVERWGYAPAFGVSAGLALLAWPYLLWAERRSGFLRRRAPDGHEPIEAPDPQLG